MLTNKEIGVLCYCRGCLNRKIGCGERKKGGRMVGTAIVRATPHNSRLAA